MSRKKQHPTNGILYGMIYVIIFSFILFTIFIKL